MKFCDAHWQQLRDEIKAVGLEALVPDNSDQAARNLQDAQLRGATIDNFDPLMGAWMRINSGILEVCHTHSPGLVAELTTKDTCPVCFANFMARSTTDTTIEDLHSALAGPIILGDFDSWLVFAAKEVLDEWKALNDAR